MPSARVIQQRRLAASGAAAVVVLVAIVAGTCAFSDGDDPDGAPAAAARERLPELPGGGRTLLPDKRIVAFYGAPQDEELGALGIGSPDEAAEKLQRQAARYEAAGGRAVVPALELITVIANADPGDDGTYRSRLDDRTIHRYLRAARRHDMLLILDIQPGRSDFFTETRRLEKWLRQPDVGLALDPEWRVQEGEVPGQVIGSVDAREVNATSAWLAMLTARNKLPQKLFIVHQFTEGMVDDRQLKRRPELAMVLNADGFGSRAAKRSKYHAFTRAAKEFEPGFKLFYKEDEGLMSAASVLRLKPPPAVVVYE